MMFWERTLVGNAVKDIREAFSEVLPPLPPQSTWLSEKTPLWGRGPG